MRTVLTYLTLALCLLPLSAVAGENSDKDKAIEALMERVKRLEAIIGEDERPILTKQTMGKRLDSIEQELRKSQSRANPQEYNLQHDLRQLNQTVQNTSRRVDELANRMNRTERETDAMPGAEDLASLRRDIERLQRQLDNLTQKLNRMN